MCVRKIQRQTVYEWLCLLNMLSTVTPHIHTQTHSIWHIILLYAVDCSVDGNHFYWLAFVLPWANFLSKYIHFFQPRCRRHRGVIVAADFVTYKLWCTCFRRVYLLLFIAFRFFLSWVCMVYSIGTYSIIQYCFSDTLSHSAQWNKHFVVSIRRQHPIFNAMWILFLNIFNCIRQNFVV